MTEALSFLDYLSNSLGRDHESEIVRVENKSAGLELGALG